LKTEVLKIKLVLLSLLITSLLYACVTSKTGAQHEGSTLAEGEKLFTNNCSSCHGFVQNGIGPQLGGLKSKVPRDYIFNMITNAEKVVTNVNARAIELKKTYDSSMPSFAHLSLKDRNSLVDYLLGQPAPPSFSNKYGKAIVNPIPQKIKLSDLVLNIEYFTTIPPSGPSNASTRIALMVLHPISGDSYIADLRGKLYRLNGKTPELYFNIADYFPNFIDKPGLATGFGAFAFHPNFVENGLFYTTHTEGPGTLKADFAFADSIKVTLQWILSEWKTEDPTATTIVAKPRELFRVDMVGGIHGMQEIAFNPLAKGGDEDFGLLYVGLGDGGAVEEGYPFIPHNRNGIWGSLLRIDPLGRNSENGKYGIPASNPFYENGNYRGEVYALGFRNPHRFTWTQSGKLLLTNIGQKQIESVNLIKPGYDFGWPFREGRYRIDEFGDLNEIFEIPFEESMIKYNSPVIEIDHDEIGAISTALEYTGVNVPGLKGKYLFTSISQTRQFFVEEKDIKEGHLANIKEFRVSLKGEIVTFNELTGNNGRADLRMGKDAKGEIYFFTKPDGKIYKVIP
jgi:glucose/arabinose dehydrogenase/mono/diheme cytochrome c family protein